MSSGEWLKGEIHSLRDVDLEFDSDDLDLLKLSWDDVAELRSARVLTYRFDDLGIASGTATMRDSIITIRSGNQVQTFPRDALLVILEGSPREINFWSAKATLGLVARAGNTDQQDLNAVLTIRREHPKTRLDMRYNGNLGQVSGEETINNHNGTITLDLLVAKGFFVNLGAVNLFKDRFVNIQLRTTLAAGVGYAIFRGGDVDWSVGLSGGYQSTQFVSVEEGQADSEDTGTIIPNTGFEWDVTGDVKISADYNAQISVPEVKNTFHSASGVFSVDIWGDIIDLDLSVFWDRTENPRPDAEGNVPKRDDFRTSFGFGISF
jgi:putative salt-induced outer membrane protein YdiY